MTDHWTQWLAYALVVTGLAATGIGDWHSWHTLANGGTTAIGFGGGILTGKFVNSRQDASQLPPGSKVTDKTTVQTPPITQDTGDAQ